MKIIKYQNKITEKSEELKMYLVKKGRYLVVAPTGGGKTYTVINSFNELSKIYKDYYFIIACPNRVQNEQNEKSYPHCEIYSLVGGNKVYEDKTKISMVYEKANEIIENHFINENMKIILVIDEAHELIYSDKKDFRHRAISQLEELESKCHTVIHLTATPRPNSYLYEYDDTIVFEPINKKDINNIGKFLALRSPDSKQTLCDSIKKLLSQNYKILLHYNNIEDSRNLQVLLQENFKGKKISLYNSNRETTRQEEYKRIHKSITEDSLIPNDIDILITSSKITNGTNLNNKGFIPIMYIDSKIHFNLDTSEQFYQRLREGSDLALLIYQDTEGKGELINLNDIIKSEIKKAECGVKSIEFTLNMMKQYTNEPIKEIKKVLDANKWSHKVGTNIYSFVEYDEEKDIVFINKKSLIRYCIGVSDTSLLNDSQELLTRLKTRIKANTFSYGVDLPGGNKDSEKLKESKASKKTSKKEYKEEKIRELREMIQDEDNKKILKTYLTQYKDESEDLKLKLTKSSMAEDLRELVDELEQEETIFKSILRVCESNRIHTDTESFRETLSIYIDSGLDEIEFKNRLYVHWNNLDFKIFASIQNEYTTIRRTLDEVKDKQGRLTEQIQYELCKKIFPKLKYRENKKLRPGQKSKLLQELERVYNLIEIKTNKEKFFKISSLKKIIF